MQELSTKKRAGFSPIYALALSVCNHKTARGDKASIHFFTNQSHRLSAYGVNNYIAVKIFDRFIPVKAFDHFILSFSSFSHKEYHL